MKGKPPPPHAFLSLSLSLSPSRPGKRSRIAFSPDPSHASAHPRVMGVFDFPPRFCRRGARLYEKNVSPVLGVKCLLPHTLPRLHTNSTQLRYRPKESWCVTVMMVVVVMMLMTMVMITIMFMMVRVEDADVSDGATYNKGSSMNFQNAAPHETKTREATEQMRFQDEIVGADTARYGKSCKTPTETAVQHEGRTLVLKGGRTRKWSACALRPTSSTRALTDKDDGRAQTSGQGSGYELSCSCGLLPFDRRGLVTLHVAKA